MHRDTYLSNGDGKRISPAVEFMLPVAGSGQTQDLTATETDYELTVVAGARYWVQHVGSGQAFLGVAAVAAESALVPAAILWTIPANQRIGIEIPTGITTLHVAGNNAGDDLYLSRSV